jgi:hypothetical protein
VTTTNHELVGRAVTELVRGLEPIIAETLRPHLLPGMSWTALLQRRDEAAGRAGGVYSETDPQVDAYRKTFVRVHFPRTVECRSALCQLAVWGCSGI